MVFARNVEGQTLTFGVSGKLIMNALVMYDHQTQSLWSQFLAESVDGELEGTPLEFIPALHTNWGTWSSLYPNTEALNKGSSNSFDPYESYYIDNKTGVLGETNSDNRLPAKTIILGLRTSNLVRAYPLDLLKDKPVINDSANDIPTLVAFDSDSGAGVVFHREIEGKTLTFDLHRIEMESTPMVIDRETGTVWEMLTGRAVEGSLKGQKLEQLPTTLAFWFAWKDFYPNTEIYGE
ncbi:DUF3179 domain-containing protein [SAR202 cluster bacterium AC-409-J13_OGT_754m]|nr:DUF3179 domain-containing protein [SAR202 cluster bacterium AC-409-J13_OGT_754m]